MRNTDESTGGAKASPRWFDDDEVQHIEDSIRSGEFEMNATTPNIKINALVIRNIAARRLSFGIVLSLSLSRGVAIVEWQSGRTTTISVSSLLVATDENIAAMKSKVKVQK
jgi:hypothetical protein